MHADPEKAREVGEHLVLMLDRLDDLAKAVLLARAFKVFLMWRIDRPLFDRLASALDRAPRPSLARLAEFYSSEPPAPGEDVAIALGAGCDSSNAFSTQLAARISSW